MPHRRALRAMAGLAVVAGLLSLCSVGPTRPGNRESRREAMAGDSSRRVRRQPIPPGRRMPALIREALLADRAAQGSGPDRDQQLTPTAMSSQEFDVATPGLEKVARVAFVTNGVDEWVNDEEPQPGDPPPPANDPNNIPDGQIDRYGVSDNGFNIWLMRQDGSQQIPVTDLAGDERDPAYDPGATVLAFCNDRTGRYQIYTVDIVTKTVRQITTTPDNKYHPTWSADGTLIAYASDANGPDNRDIHVVRSDGVGGATPLIATPSDEFEPMWSPNGQWLLYTRLDGQATHIWRADSAGQNQEQLTNGGGVPTVNDQNPSWRQDGLGTAFAFASDRRTDITDTITEFNIWTVGASGEIGGATPLPASNLDVADTYDDIMPAFSPLLAPVPSAAPIRVFFTSRRLDKTSPPTPTAEPDIWGLVVDDARPPILEELPTVSNRNPAPGSDVVVSAKPFDQESGIRSVFAWFKDPDSAYEDAVGINHKIFFTGSINMEPIHGPLTSCPNPFEDEWECQRVGSTELFDDGDVTNHGDAVAGDGWFSGIWTTPAVPSDFIIDIELTDNAAGAGNFINYDDVYGFSTVSFAPRNNILFVDDYCEGQAWLAQVLNTNDGFAGAACESYFTLNNGGAGSPNTIADGSYGEDFDIWRVICRGAPSLTALQYYGPTSETQLDPADLETLREVPVANRCLFWAAPHTGDVWAADGTVAEAGTQAMLTTFVQRGGRLAMAGMDIAWALTLEGQYPNAFLTNVLGANFVSDDNSGGRDFPQDINFDLTGTGGDPVADDTWDTAIHWTDSCVDGLACGPGTDGSVMSPFPDIISAAGSQVVFVYTGERVAGVRKEDQQTGSRVVYFAFPFEALSRRYDGNCAVREKRHKLMHMTLCYLRTGGIQGRVVGMPGLRPIVDPEPIVTVLEPGGTTVLYAQRCNKDGTYVISGVPPNRYEVKATRPGYTIDKPNDLVLHGGLSYPTQDFVITVAQPGAIQGTVTSLATGDPVAGVTVTAVSATDPTAPALPPATTAADGTYVIPNAPVDDYDVTADGSTATPPYGSDTQTVTVVPGGTVTQDFQLPAADGTLQVTVVDAQTQAPLKDVTVDAILNKVVVGTGLTDDTGLATLDLPPGTYDLVADRPGYAQATATGNVLSAQITTARIEMDALPPGSIVGQITRTSTPNEPLRDVAVQVIVSGTIIGQALSDDTWTYPTGGNPRYNYRVDNVPSGGRVEVRALKTGFTVTPASRTVTVSSGATTFAVNFQISALHTFPAGLQFMSVPFDYSNQLPPFVLGTPAGQALKLAAWDVSLGRYASYPTSPADRLRLGTAYWLNQAQAQDLVTEGARANTPYLIPLGIGWNGIGNPFTTAVDFFSLKVRDGSGVVRPIQDAFSLGQVRNGLFAYGVGGYRLSTSLAPYAGYWLYAGQAVSLVVDNPDAAAAVAAAGPRRTALAKPQGGWLAALEVWQDGLCDASTAFGVAADPATASVPKPPPPEGRHFIRAAFTGADGVAQAVDVRGAGKQEWALSIHAPSAETPVTVTWPDLSQLPATARPVLRDPNTGRTVYMRTQREYSYRPVGRGEYRLTIAAGDSPQGVLTVSGASAAATPQGVSVTCTLSRDAQLTAEVLNLGGRLVGLPLAARPMPAGASVVLWNARNQDGNVVPAGMYLVKLTARSDDGQQASAVVAVNVRR